MDDTRLLSAIESAEELAYGRQNDELSVDREEAINAYLGKPYGNEVEGQSQIVSRDVMDTIEWIKPSLLRIFTGGDEIVRFDPVGPEDEETAKQETDYVNYVIQQKNNWFYIFNTWISDALLTKNAYAMAYWDEKEDTTKDRHEGLTEDQLALLAQDQSIEITGYSANPMGGFDVELQKKKKYGCVKIEVLPPERCLISQNTTGVSVRNTDFFGYWEMKTLSDLRSMGFDVDDDISDDAGSEFGLEDSARDQYGERGSILSTDPTDPSMRRVRVRMVWLKHDYDDDGLAEYRYCVVVGKTLLLNEECSGIPVACIVPTPLPHRHPGLSIADVVMDIQYIQSMIQRQILNNLYLSNNPRVGVDKDRVNIEDMLTSRVGGIVRTEGSPHQSMMPLVVPMVAAQGLPIIEFFNQVKENRTGTNRYFSGTDEGSLNKTATGIAQLTSSAAQRVEMIARIVAEGVKELFGVVHELTLKHAREPEIVRLRNQWVPVDPREWKNRQDMTIAVGLGTGNKEVVAANMMNVLKTQMATLPIGVASPEGIRESALELTKAYGFPSPEKFWPETQQKPPMDPAKLQEAMKQLEQEKQGIEQGKQQLQQEGIKIKDEANKLELEKIEFDYAKSVATLELQHKSAQEQNKRELAEVDPEGSSSKLKETKERLAQYEALVEQLQQPKEIIKGPDGRAIAVKQGDLVHEVIRGPDGRPQGLQLR